jgi:hypothetical protein
MPLQFEVPQFIEREAQLIGPFSVKQAAILGLAGAVLFVMWTTMEKWLFFIVSPFVVIGTLGIVFLKVNGRPAINAITSFFSFFVSPQLYIWQKRKQKKAKKQQIVEVFEGTTTNVTTGEIKKLAKRLDI